MTPLLLLLLPLRDRSGKGWQRLLRRGLHTLTRPQYQLLYVLDGLYSPLEREASKDMRATEVVRPPRAA